MWDQLDLLSWYVLSVGRNINKCIYSTITAYESEHTRYAVVMYEVTLSRSSNEEVVTAIMAFHGHVSGTESNSMCVKDRWSRVEFTKSLIQFQESSRFSNTHEQIHCCAMELKYLDRNLSSSNVMILRTILWRFREENKTRIPRWRRILWSLFEQWMK